MFKPTLTLTLPSEATWPPQRATFQQDALGLLLEEIGLCAKNLITILGPIINIIRGANVGSINKKDNPHA